MTLKSEIARILADISDADSLINRLHVAGYAIVPKVPSKAAILTGAKKVIDHLAGDAPLIEIFEKDDHALARMNASEVWAAMVKAGER